MNIHTSRGDKIQPRRFRSVLRELKCLGLQRTCRDSVKYRYASSTIRGVNTPLNPRRAAKKPTITMTALQEQLERECGHDFHFSYLRKLGGKVRNEIIHDVDRATIEPRLAELRENYRLMREELLKIVYWTPENGAPGVPKPLARDRVEAAKSVVMLDLAVLNAEAAARMFKKPVEELARQVSLRGRSSCCPSLIQVAHRDLAE